MSFAFASDLVFLSVRGKFVYDTYFLSDLKLHSGRVPVGEFL